ncbi:SulP family inorganic anion transporter [Mumia sp. Pv 4-285]|uniref:SulP family inorganic anion transporter n=1 Tax=Mumia qirimensis TaxID=3234852 RepID=UPI00351D054F
MAGTILGVESVPDGLANGLLAGVNPVAGLYAYLYGLVGGALVTGSGLMAVQGTGAMAIIVSDVDLDSTDDPMRSLFTLTVLTGVVMVAAGLLGLARFLRFVSTSVMTGFVTAVGINIVLGQLDNLTGYVSHGANRVLRALDLLLHPWAIDPATLLVGALTILGILGLRHTRLGAMGLVVAVAATSLLALALNSAGSDVAVVADVADVPRSLPAPVLPALGEIPWLLLPALSLAFVGLVQGAAVASAFPARHGAARPDASQDFVGQGAGNLLSGLFQGNPVGGSMGASSLVATAGAHGRRALLVGAAVMAVVIFALAPVVERVAMPSLAGLLIVVGAGAVRIPQIVAAFRTGPVPVAVMVVTFALTLVVPLQYAVLVGVGMSVLMFVIQQSTRLTLRRLTLDEQGRVIEGPPPSTLPPRTVVVLQPYGPLFFASTDALHRQLPSVTARSQGSVVILRIRGADEAGLTLLDALDDYASELRETGSRLVVVTDNPRLTAQLRRHRTGRTLGLERVYEGTEVVGEALTRAVADARAWIARQS